MIYREEEHVRLLKEQTREAVRLAMNGEWAEAARLNREILEAAPDNVEAMNRLGKALTELGEPGQALDAFRRALALSPGNPIAAKNVERLLAGTSSGSAAMARACNGAGGTLKPRMFIADHGKSADVTLLASPGANPSPGTPVALEANGSTLGVMAPDGSCLGLVPPNMARRLICLISGGNRYDGAVSGTANGAVRVVLREAYQHPSQRSRVSFPAQPRPVVEPVISALEAMEAPDTTPVNVPEVPLSLLDDSPELAAVGAGIGIFDDALLPDLPEDDE
ncbi:MAG: tetratricopeptide repeat protein [Chloroflexota bacterium]|nr:tetratricopeptide repeat protein [Chloroflexota bacterium]MDE2884404.1 tetratricopeptide repeat protein [Chloroflexota bacterium]